MNNGTLSVSELGIVVRAALEQALPYGAWVQGEIRSIHRSRGGHVYFDLVETADEDAGERPIAMVSVALFQSHRERVNRTLTSHGNAIRMSDGVRIRIQGVVDYYPPAGRLQLRMSAIDPTFTLGVIAAEREALLRELARTGLLRVNGSLKVPPVPLRIGLVTSLNSAAHADVITVFDNSAMAFTLAEIDTAVQGLGAEQTIAAGVSAAVEDDVDLVLVVRGGGSKTDLAVFDHALVARAIATAPVPVFTGIGHDIDRSVADEVAHTAHTTPTAAAQAVVGIVTAWLARLSEHERTLVQAGRQALAAAERRLVGCRRQVSAVGQAGIAAAVNRLAGDSRRIGRAADRVDVQAMAQVGRAMDRVVVAQRHSLRFASGRVDTAEARVRALDPALALARGWSITRGPDGSVVRSVTDVAPGVELSTRVADGEVVSTITSVEPADA